MTNIQPAIVPSPVLQPQDLKRSTPELRSAGDTRLVSAPGEIKSSQVATARLPAVRQAVALPPRDLPFGDQSSGPAEQVFKSLKDLKISSESDKGPSTQTNQTGAAFYQLVASQPLREDISEAIGISLFV